MPKKRGRKSAAAMAVAKPVIAFQRRLPPPPERLTPEQAELWRAVVGSPAGDAITKDTYSLLEEFCVAVVASRRIRTEFDRFEAGWSRSDEGLKRWDKLQSMHDRAARLVAALARGLRLTVQSRTHPTTAGRHVIDQPDSDRPKPWDPID